jgi:transcriptional regulator with XRE-family HTH domain
MEKHADLIALGQQIRKIRIAKDFSQEGFASEVNMERSYYGGVERGERNASARNLMKIARALKVRVGDLFPD